MWNEMLILRIRFQEFGGKLRPKVWFLACGLEVLFGGLECNIWVGAEKLREGQLRTLVYNP